MIITGAIAYIMGQLHFTKGIVAAPHLLEGLFVFNPISSINDVIQYRPVLGRFLFPPGLAIRYDGCFARDSQTG
ncbi:hypothetical protein D0466_14670 [Peribacillus glennii]|uniref:Uncharacterized protein n=1 Tax=Peribacillus glennii TaxID=2303991 RepID=A0A372LAK0_9BACI|nr:hypothetical protein D0466_14670 [Peribacillus glennii]